MTKSLERLKSALANRYAIERELASGGMAYTTGLAQLYDETFAPPVCRSC